MSVLLFLADGFEEIEALTVVDMLRRAGADISMVSIMENAEVTGAHGITVKADVMFAEADFDKAEMLVLPGGMPGTLNLDAHEGLTEKVVAFAKEGKCVAAICAAPSVLGRLGVLNGKKAVCYPGLEEKLEGANVQKEPVVWDGNIITSRGMGTAIEFAGVLIEKIYGAQKKEQILDSIIYNQ